MSGPQPTPQPAPTPTPMPDVSQVALPQVPPNTYELLSGLADAIDTANGNFTTHAGKLAGISQEVNGAVNNVTSNSSGNATTALSDTWKSTQTDFTNAHDPLTGITSASCLGGAPNPLRASLDQHKSAIQTGLIAMENIQVLQRSCPLHPPSAQQVQAWIDEVNALTGALGNVNLALETMILALRNLNGGFAATCATGFTPGMPPPTFPNNAFASTSSGGGGGGKLTFEQLADYLKGKRVDPALADDIALWAEENNLNLDDVQSLTDALISKGENPNQVLSWIQSGKINAANLGDVTALANKGITSDVLNQLFNSGADLSKVSADVTTLLNGSYAGVDGAKVSQWIQKGLNLKYTRILLDRGVSVGTIDSNISSYLDPSTGGAGWRDALRNQASGLRSAFQRWSTGGSLGPGVGAGHDGLPFRNDPVWYNGKQVAPFPNPVGTVREYYVDPTGSARILVDDSGTAYYYPNHYEDIGSRVKVPFSYIIAILGK